MGEISLEDVREALAHLYDPEALGLCQIARVIAPGSEQAQATEIGQVIRRALLDAMSELKPTGPVAPTASHYRAHECITLRYVSRLSAEEIADELSLSKRQVYRDLRWGEQRLAEVLQSLLADYAASRQDPLGQEIKALVGKSTSMDLEELVASAIAAVSPLARSRGVHLAYAGTGHPVQVSASPGILREVLIQVLSALAQSLEHAQATVRLSADDEYAYVAFPVARPERLARADLLEAALRIAGAQGLAHDFVGTDLCQVLRIRLPLLRRRRLLVVEDNPAVFALYRRYLENTNWQPVLVPSPQEAGRVAAEGAYHAVLLDIMMPEADGWSVLQELKLDARTRSLPVIVCSVVDDPELGRALGAAVYLTKPVEREALVRALDQVAGPGTPRPASSVRTG
ncbi:MAG: response regulator [Anaerolineae bacterium]|nr:response regulator [Anaerolineae bacterium]